MGPVFPTVSSGLVVTQVVLVADSGDDTTSPLMLWINSATGLPDTANGSDIDVDPDTGAFKAFSF